jgi:hypothetical protein
MGHHVDLAEARRAVPVIERADRNFAPDCRIKACTAALAAARRELHIAEQAVIAFRLANRPCCSRAGSKAGSSP